MSVRVVLRILEARNLKAADVNGLSDPYVVVECEGRDAHKTAVQRKTLSPVWRNEQCTLTLSDVSSKVMLRVWDWDRLSAADELGVAVFDPNAVRLNAEEFVSLWLPVSIKGELRIEVNVAQESFLLAEQERAQAAERQAAAENQRDEQLSVLRNDLSSGKEFRQLNAQFWDDVFLDRTTKKFGGWRQCKLDFDGRSVVRVRKQAIMVSTARADFQMDSYTEITVENGVLTLENDISVPGLPLKISFVGCYNNGDLTGEEALQLLHQGFLRAQEVLRQADPEWQSRQQAGQARRDTLGPVLHEAGLPDDLIDYLCDNEGIGLTDVDSLEALEEADFIEYGCTKVEARAYIKKIRSIQKE